MTNQSETADSKPEVIICRIGNYGPVDSIEMATVIYDGKKIAECYTNEDAELIGTALSRCNAQPVSSAVDEIKPLYVGGYEITSTSIIKALVDGDLLPEEAVQWIEKLIRHQTAQPSRDDVLEETEFSKAMEGRIYGEEETKDAKAWFSAGWSAAIRALKSKQEERK